jgi:predicted dehydrogenase
MTGARAVQPRPRLGFLGLGWIGRNRLEALIASDAAEVSALYDPDAKALEVARALAPDARVVSSISELLEQPLDGLVIATPSALHAEQALAALERGLPVFCQKPLGRNAAEVTRIVDAARNRQRSLAVDLSYRRTQAIEELAKVIRTGSLGNIFAVNLVFHNAYGPDKPWFYEREHAGGGALMDLGIHLLDLLLWLLDYPDVTGVASQLYAQGRPLQRAATHVEDYAAAQLTLATGAVVQLACSWRLHAGCDCVIAADFFGTEGGVSFRNQHGSFYDFTTQAFNGTQQRNLSSPPDAWGGRALVDWARRLSRDPGFDPECQRLVDLARLLDRLYEAGSAPEQRTGC